MKQIQKTLPLYLKQWRLSALGYSDREIKRVEKQLKEVDNQTTDEYLPQALKLMKKNKEEEPNDR